MIVFNYTFIMLELNYNIIELMFSKSGRNNTKEFPARNSPNGKRATIQTIKRQGWRSTCRKMESTARNANLDIR